MRWKSERVKEWKTESMKRQSKRNVKKSGCMCKCVCVCVWKEEKASERNKYAHKYSITFVWRVHDIGQRRRRKLLWYFILFDASYFPKWFFTPLYYSYILTLIFLSFQIRFHVLLRSMVSTRIAFCSFSCINRCQCSEYTQWWCCWLHSHCHCYSYCYCLVFTIAERLALECWKYLCNSVRSMDFFCLISSPFHFRHADGVCASVCFFNCLSVVCFYVLSLNWLAKLMAFPLLLEYFGLSQCISSKGKKPFSR